MPANSNDGSNSSRSVTDSSSAGFVFPRCLIVAKNPASIDPSRFRFGGDTATVGTVQELVPILRSAASAKGLCKLYPSCPSCRDVGAFRHCKIDFRISAWLLLMEFDFNACFVEDDKIDIQRVRIYSADEDMTPLAQLLGELQFARYSMDNIPEAIIPSLGRSLSASQALKVLEFHGVDFVHSTLHLIKDILASSKSLQQLHMVECFFPMIDIEAIDLDEHHDFEIDPLCFEPLRDGIQSSSSLKLVRIRDCGVPSEGLCAILADSTPTLEKILVGGNGCDRALFEVIGTLLKNDDCKLRSLDLSYLSGETDIEPMAVALASNKTLSELDMGWNDRIPDAGVEHLFESLQTNRTLEKLSLYGFRGQDMGMDETMGPPSCLTDHGFRMLGKKLQGMVGLKHLDISANDISREASEEISRGLRAHSTLNSLSIREVGTIEQILDAVGDNLSLHSLDVSGTVMDGESIHLLMTALKKNCNLRVLSTNSCCIDNKCMEIIGQNLPHINLEEWVMDWNKFDVEGTMKFVSGLGDNTSLKRLRGFKQAQASVEYFLQLNRGGRFLIKEDPPASLWAHVLGKAAKCRNIEMIYFFLKQTNLYRFH